MRLNLLGWVMVLSFIQGLFLITWTFSSDAARDKEDRLIQDYIDLHYCQMLGRVGMDATRQMAYQCDNGKMLEMEIRKKVAR